MREMIRKDARGLLRKSHNGLLRGGDVVVLDRLKPKSQL